MGKDKLKRFAENETFEHLFQPNIEVALNEEWELKGKWASEFFGNDNPIILELGCGKGEYTVGLAERYPNKNFIGVDIKGARIWRGAKTVQENEMKNVAFLRTKVEFIGQFFAPEEVEEIWLTFSDPQPKDEKGTKRITSFLFFGRYKRFVKKGGLIHVKTDSDLIYQDCMETLPESGYNIVQSTNDLYGDFFDSLNQEDQDVLSIRTFYEQKWLDQGDKINYLKVRI